MAISKITENGLTITDLTIADDLTVTDDLLLASDGAILKFGTDADVTLTHVHNTGLTLNTGLTVTGTSTLNDDVTFTGANYNVTWDKSDNALEFGDNAKANFGAGNDLQIYHDGSHSYVSDQGTGGLYLLGSVLRFGNQDNDEHYGGADDDGSVYFKYDNVKKFETTAGGIKIDGAGLTDGTSGLYIFDDRTSGNRASNLATSASNAGFTYKGHTTDSTALNFSYDTGVAGAYNMQNSNGSTGYYICINPYAGGIGFQNNGSATPTAHQGFQIDSGILYCCDNTNNANYKLRFYNTNGMIGSIFYQNSATSFLTSSDYRLKENEKAMSGSVDRIKQLKPYTFNFKKSPDITNEGFFAHEVADIIPQAVTGEKDAMEKDVDGETDIVLPQQVDYAKVVPLLTSALQEAIAKIETLEAKVKTLEEA